MATITQDDVLDVAPEFLSDTSRIQRVIDLVAPGVSDAAFGSSSKIAASLLVAHFLTVTSAGYRGPVRSETVGDVSRGYGDPTAGMGDTRLAETSYGRQYLAVRDANVIGFLTGLG